MVVALRVGVTRSGASGCVGETGRVNASGGVDASGGADASGRALVVGASGVADASERASEGGDASDQGTGEAALGQWFLIWITAVWLASPLPETDCASADVMQRGADARNDAREGNVVAVLRSY